MVAMILVIMNEPLPRPAQPSQALLIFSIATPRLNCLPRRPCLLFVSDLQLQKAGLGVRRGYRQKRLPEKEIAGRSRNLQLGNRLDQGQKIGKIRLGLFEPFDLLLSLFENSLNQGWFSLSEGRQEVTCEMPRCEVCHKG